MPASIQYSKARYTPSPVGEFRNNAFIEALPVIPDDPRLLAGMLLNTYEIDPFQDAVNKDRALDRVAESSFICLPRNVRLFKTVDELIRDGYLARKGVTGSRLRSLGDYRQHEQKSLDEIRAINLKETVHHASHISLIGCHGSGKSYALRRILSFYPQVIYHLAMSSHDPLQIVYLKTDCRKGGTIRDLYLDIIGQIGRLTGQDFSGHYEGKRPGSVLLRRIAHRLMANYSLGVLVVDQVENLMDTRAKRDELFTFIESCSTGLDTPLVLVGATRILNYAKKDQRVPGFFDRCVSFSWQRFQPEGTCYRNFLRLMWQQLALANDKKYVPREIESAFYYYSQGIVTHLVSLFVLSVKLALARGTNYLTPSLVRDCFELYFTDVKGKITALRDKNRTAFRKLQSQTFSKEQFDRCSNELSARIKAL